MNALRMMGDMDRRGAYRRPALPLGEVVSLMVEELRGLSDCPEFRETKIYVPRRAEDRVTPDLRQTGDPRRLFCK